MPGRTERGTIICSREGANGSGFLTTSRPSGARLALCKYRLTSFAFVIFFDGLVPCFKCAWVLRRSASSAWVARHVDRVVNGRLAFPVSTSCTVMAWMTESSVWATKEQTWHFGWLHGAALRHEKSDGKLTDPLR